MTNTTLAEALDHIAVSASNHLRILTAIQDNKMALAQNLLEFRICNLFDDYADGDVKMEDHWIALCLETPGPLLHRAIREATARRLKALT